MCHVLSHVQLFATPWSASCQAPLSIGFSREEFWSGLPFPPPGESSHPGIEFVSPALHMDSLPTETLGKPQNSVRLFKKSYVIKYNFVIDLNLTVVLFLITRNLVPRKAHL